MKMSKFLQLDAYRVGTFLSWMMSISPAIFLSCGCNKSFFKVWILRLRSSTFFSSTPPSKEIILDHFWSASVGFDRKSSWMKFSLVAKLSGESRWAIRAFRTPSSSKLDSLLIDSSWYTFDSCRSWFDFHSLTFGMKNSDEAKNKPKITRPKIKKMYLRLRLNIRQF